MHRAALHYSSGTMTSVAAAGVAIPATPRSQALDACRGIAVLMVVLCHLPLSPLFDEMPVGLQRAQEAGAFGVDLFYVLSGYFIAAAVLRPPQWDPARFAVARITRIYPAYLVAIAAYLVPLVIARGVSAEMFANTMLHVTMLHNFLPRTNAYLNTVFWTLGVEFPFYLLMLALAPFLRERGWFRVIAATMIGIAILWRTVVFIEIEGEYRYWVLSQLPGALDAFALGAIVASLMHGAAAATIARWRWVLLGSGAVLSGAALGYCAQFPAERFWMLPFGAMLWRSGLAIAFALVVAGCCTMPAGRLLARTGLPWIGKVSYSIYLFHPLVIGTVTATSPTLDWPAKLALMGIGIVLVGWASWRFVESRFHRSQMRNGPPIGGPLALETLSSEPAAR